MASRGPAARLWAYFPVYRLRLIARKLQPKPETRVLLVLSTAHFDRQPVRRSCDELRDHLGHVLLYLRKPKARNECADALAEWGPRNEAGGMTFAKSRAGYIVVIEKSRTGYGIREIQLRRYSVGEELSV